MDQGTADEVSLEVSMYETLAKLFTHKKMKQDSKSPGVRTGTISFDYPADNRSRKLDCGKDK